MFFMFYQTVGETPWKMALATERESLVRSGVEFVSVLDVDNSFSQPLSAEEIASVKYLAPNGFYADFDGDLDEVLNQARVFLLKLQQEHSFDVSQAKLWFTGGRGVHIEIPLECFLPKIPTTGIQYLPAIFKEIAMSTYVDTLDLRVYSAQRGRQWRVQNVKRANGKHKVQVTSEEFFTATLEDYERICSSPRLPIQITAPVCNPKLTLLYTLAKEKVDLATKRRKTKKVSTEHVNKFDGKWPESFQTILRGQNLKEGLGWNQIAMQVASFGLALGKTESEIIDDASDLIEAHSGDSSRYGTVQKRVRELRNQIRYQDQNPSYEFSIGAVKSLFRSGVSTPDLDWAGVFGEEDSDDGDEGEDSDDLPSQPCEASLAEISRKANEETLNRVSLMYSRQGIFMKTEHGPAKVCSAGFAKPTRLAKITDGSVIGYEVDVIVDSVPQGRHILPMNSMTSKAAFSCWLSTWSASISAPEAIVPQLADLLRVKTHGETMLTVGKEGVDVVTPPTIPGAEKQRPTEIIFATPDRVYSVNNTPLKFRGANDAHGAFKSDLWSADELTNDDMTREYLNNLFNINEPEIIGKVLGWFVASFMCQPIRRVFGQFPLLQAWGQAGSGKTKTLQLANHMHYWRHEPKQLSAVGSTFFPLMAAVTQSASLPVFFDEYKPRNMSNGQKNMLLNIFRNNYAGMDIERGSLSRDSGEKQTVVNSYSNTAPILFIGEALETESAIMERSVIVPFTKEGRFGRRTEFDYVFDRRSGYVLSSLGKAIVQVVLSSTVQDLANKIRAHKQGLEKDFDDQMIDEATRPLFNLAVVLGGLDLLRVTLQTVFEGFYDDTLDTLHNGVMASSRVIRLSVLPEAAKVMDVIAQLTRERDTQFRLEKDLDYVTDQITVDLNMRLCYAKYVRYQRSLGMEVLYDNVDAFLAGMRSYQACIDSSGGLESPIRRTPFEKIFRFSCQKMADEGVESFFEV